jgi:hypothetical protein
MGYSKYKLEWVPGPTELSSVVVYVLVVVVKSRTRSGPTQLSNLGEESGLEGSGSGGRHREGEMLHVSVVHVSQPSVTPSSSLSLQTIKKIRVRGGVLGVKAVIGTVRSMAPH